MGDSVICPWGPRHSSVPGPRGRAPGLALPLTAPHPPPKQSELDTLVSPTHSLMGSHPKRTSNRTEETLSKQMEADGATEGQGGRPFLGAWGGGRRASSGKALRAALLPRRAP